MKHQMTGTRQRYFGHRHFPRSIFHIGCSCLIIFLAAATLALLSGIPATAQERFLSFSSGTIRKMTLPPGTTQTIETDAEIAELVIGNEAIADAYPISANAFYVQGNSVGFTNITIYDANKKLLGVLEIRVQVSFADLEATISQAVPRSSVFVQNLNNRIRLSGTVRNPAELKRVLEIAEQFSNEPVINSLRITGSQQVRLNVRILEVQRNSGRELGVNLNGTKGGRQRISTGNPLVGTDSGLVSSSLPFGTFIGSLLEIAGIDIDIVISALEEKGVARRLANPTLVTKSGMEANFVVGGEVPIQSSFTAENGSIATETSYREYGVRLNFKPVVLDDGMIDIYIRPEVSEVDFSIEVNGNPGFITRKAETTVSLRDGQSFAIAGLLQTDNARRIRQVPWLGNIPVLGTLFRSTAFQKRETDLVIVVTPSIVKPASARDQLRSPLSAKRSTDDIELFLLGLLEVDRKLLRSFKNGKGITGPYGHMIDLEFNDVIVKKK